MLERFGYSDEDAFAVGLTCGGVIDILVTPVRADAPARAVFAAALSAAAAARRRRSPGSRPGRRSCWAAPCCVRPDGSYEGALGGHPELDRTAAAEARAMLDAGRTGTVRPGWRRPRADGVRGEAAACGQPLTLLVESCVPPPA